MIMLCYRILRPSLFSLFFFNISYSCMGFDPHRVCLKPVVKMLQGSHHKKIIQMTILEQVNKQCDLYRKEREEY